MQLLNCDKMWNKMKLIFVMLTKVEYGFKYGLEHGFDHDFEHDFEVLNMVSNMPLIS